MFDSFIKVIDYNKKVQIYAMNAGVLNDEHLYRLAYNSLSTNRRRKADAFVFRKDKNLSICAGLLLDQGLRYYGLKEKEVQIVVDQNGKPYLKDYLKIHYNISHSEDFALVVFADAPVGCDIEKIKPFYEELASSFFNEKECEYIFNQKEKSNGRFFDIWTKKESYLKMMGMGMIEKINTINVLQPDNRFTFREIYIDEDYRAVYCISHSTKE